MNLIFFIHLPIVWISCAIVRSAETTDLPACSPDRNEINVDASVSGRILNPQFPDKYADVTCTWKIRASEGLRLKLTIELLRMKGVDDVIIIRDGVSDVSPLIGKYGPCAKGTLTLFSSGNWAYIQMVVPTFSQKNELRIAFWSTYPDDIDCSSQGESLPNYCAINTKLTHSSGVIASPNFPSNYGSDENCVWTITASPGHRVQIAIEWLGIKYPSPRSCVDDNIYISDDRGNFTKVVKVLCGCDELFTFHSTKNRIWVMFNSYMSSNWPGFYATYRALSPDECESDAKICKTFAMDPIGFNAQGQVCKDLGLIRTTTTSAIKSSSPMMHIEASSQTKLVTTSPHSSFSKINDRRVLAAAPSINSQTPSKWKNSKIATASPEVVFSALRTHNKGRPSFSGDRSSLVQSGNWAANFTSNNHKSLGRSKLQGDNIITVTHLLNSKTHLSSRSLEEHSPVAMIALTPGLTRYLGTSITLTGLKNYIDISSTRETTVLTTESIDLKSKYNSELRENIKLLESSYVATKETIYIERISSRIKNYHVSRSHQEDMIRPSVTSTLVNNALSKAVLHTSKADVETNAVASDSPSVESSVVHLPSKGIFVRCTHYQMEITITTTFYPYVDLRTLHLLDPSCRLYSFNSTHALLTAPLDGCGTKQNTLKTHFVYSNTVMGEAKSANSSSLITREGKIKVDFQCLFEKLRVLSIVSYSPRQKKFYTSDDSFGNFTFEMDMFKNAQYDIIVTEYPVIVYSGQPMYFQVDVKSRDKSLLIFLDECWVTASPNPRDKTRTTVIKNGCPRDSTLEHSYQNSSTQKFTFAAFRFRDVSSPRLFVHCEVITCARSDTGSVCYKGCTETKRSRRERVGILINVDASLSLGPINIRKVVKGTYNESTRFVTMLAGCLGGLVICLLIATVILIIIQRKKTRAKWTLILTRDPRINGSR